MKKTSTVAKTKKSRKRAGFTLIEIIAALAVLALGILSILSLFPFGQQASNRSGKISKATILGQQKMEEMTRESRELFQYDIGEGIGIKDSPNILGAIANDTFDAPHDFYEWEYMVDPLPANDNARLVFFSLGVYWPADLGDPSDRSRQQNVRFSTYIVDFAMGG